MANYSRQETPRDFKTISTDKGNWRVKEFGGRFNYEIPCKITPSVRGYVEVGSQIEKGLKS